MEIIVSTSQKADHYLEQRGMKVAKYLNADFVPRKNLKSISGIKNPLLVITKSGISCYYNDKELFYHPSMAMLRIKRILKGEEDIFTIMLGQISGFNILDCTLGFGSDALIFSFLAGENGSVTALEKNKIIYTIVADGLKGNYQKWEEINQYTNGINPLNIDYTDFLYNSQPKSFDIVYFDPMFEKPINQSVHLEPLRAFAEEMPLKKEVVEQAKIVAKKYVIIKNTLDFDFNVFGNLREFSKRASKIKYGILEV